MEILSLIFGESGKGAEIFGMWYIVAFFILGFFILMLVSQKTSGENITFFIFSFFLLILGLGLFSIPASFIITPIVIMIIFISLVAFSIVNR